MKIYNLVAVYNNEQGHVIATRVAEGEAHGLAIEIGLLPPGTYRIAVMEKKKFDLLSEHISARAALGSGSSTALPVDEA